MPAAANQPSESEVKLGLSGAETVGHEAEIAVDKIRQALSKLPAEPAGPNPFEETPAPKTEGDIDIDRVFAGIETETVGTGEGILLMRQAVSEDQTQAMILQTEWTHNPEGFTAKLKEAIRENLEVEFDNPKALKDIAHFIVESTDKNKNPVNPSENPTVIKNAGRILFNKGVKVTSDNQVKDLINLTVEKILATEPTPGIKEAAEKAARDPRRMGESTVIQSKLPRIEIADEKRSD